MRRVKQVGRRRHVRVRLNLVKRMSRLVVIVMYLFSGGKSILSENFRWIIFTFVFIGLRWYWRIQRPCEATWAEYFASSNRTKEVGDSYFGVEHFSLQDRLHCDPPGYDTDRGYRPWPHLKCHRTFIHTLFPIDVEVMHMRPLVIRLVKVFSKTDAQAYSDFSDELRGNLTLEQMMYAPGKREYSSTRTVVQFASTSSKASFEYDHIAQKIQRRLQDVTGIDFMWLDRILGITYYDGPTHQHALHSDFVALQKEDIPSFPRQILNSFKNDMFHSCFRRTCLPWRTRLVCLRGALYQLWLLLTRGRRRNNVNQREDNRLMSFIVYVKVPEYGGRTIFPRIGLTGDAEVGDVVAFMIARPDGTQDPLMQHASCPIVEGRKLIATVIPRERGQEFRCRCPLESKLPLNHYDLESFAEGALKNLYSQADDDEMIRVLMAEYEERQKAAAESAEAAEEEKEEEEVEASENIQENN